MIIANEMHVEINDFKKNCIVFTSDTESNCQGGMSKIGGNPDVPETFTWPVYRVLENGKEVPHYPETPLSFVAQFNLEEIAEYDKDNVLPHHGMLYFFYELGDIFCDVTLKGEHSQRVYYFDTDAGSLREQGYPEHMPGGVHVKESGLAFSVLSRYRDSTDNGNPLYTNIWYEGAGHMGLCDLSIASPLLSAVLSGEFQKVDACDQLEILNEDCLKWLDALK